MDEIRSAEAAAGAARTALAQVIQELGATVVAKLPAGLDEAKRERRVELLIVARLIQQAGDGLPLDDLAAACEGSTPKRRRLRWSATTRTSPPSTRGSPNRRTLPAWRAEGRGAGDRSGRDRPALPGAAVGSGRAGDHGRRRLPVLAYDLFVNFADERACAGLQVLADLARSTQVLVFTHHPHLLGLARLTVVAEAISECPLPA